MWRFVAIRGGIGTRHEIGRHTAQRLVEDAAPDPFAAGRENVSSAA